MGNDLTRRLWVLDTAPAILTDIPVIIRRVVLFPAAAADILALNSWDAGVPATSSSGTVTITSTNIITEAGGTLFPNTYRDGDIVKITAVGSGTAANKQTCLLTTTGDNAHVDVAQTLANDTAKVYSWERYAYYLQIYLRGGASDASAVTIDYGDSGLSVPNLILETLTASAVAHIYLL
jgi:hypothetical protein